MIGLDTILSIGEKVLDRVMPDPAAAAQAKLELAKQAQDGRLKEIEAQFKDIDSARNREAQIATSEAAPLLNKIITPILALSITGLSFVLFGVIIFMEVTPQAKDILIYVLGVLSALVTQVASYYFGSSMGSKDKTEELRKVLK
jgi:energy-converting hydrogenase Eha subunit A